jgi:hypothetical protein
MGVFPPFATPELISLSRVLEKLKFLERVMGIEPT